MFGAKALQVFSMTSFGLRALRSSIDSRLKPVAWLIQFNNETEAPSRTEARFPLGDFVRATRSENKNPALWLVEIGWRKNSPRTSKNCSYFFVCSHEQSRQVKNRL